MIVQLTIYGTPQPAGSKRAVTVGTKEAKANGQGRPVVIDANPKAKSWKTAVAKEAGELMQGKELLRGALAVRFTFYQRRPKGHFGKRGILPSADQYPISRPDCLKLARGVEDALQGIVYFNDSQIVRELLEKNYGTPERVEVTVAPMRAPEVQVEVLLQSTMFND